MFDIKQFENNLFKLVSGEINKAYESLERHELESRGVALQKKIMRVLQDVTEDAIINISHSLVLALRQQSK